MSSILKALQKLERDTSDSLGPHDPNRSLRQLVPRKMAGRSRGLLIRNAAFTAFAAVFLGAVSWALWHHPLPASRNTIEQTSRETQQIVEPPLPASPTADRSRMPAASPAESEPRKTVLSPPAGRDAESITAAPTQSTGMAPNAPATMPPLPKKTPAKPTVPAAQSRPLAPEPRPAEALPAAAPAQTGVRKTARTMVDGATNTLRTTGKHEDLPIKTPNEAGLSIQALVWSAAPEDRLVVVNGSILKEGGAIEGASVTFIGEDYIIVKKDGARWKLEFQLK